MSNKTLYFWNVYKRNNNIYIKVESINLHKEIRIFHVYSRSRPFGVTTLKALLPGGLGGAESSTLTGLSQLSLVAELL